MPTRSTQDLNASVKAAEAIVKAYRESTSVERAAGHAWYPNAQRTARQLWPKDPTRAAGVLAAMSPQTQWAVNVARAATVIGWHLDHGDHEPFPSVHFKGQMVKAFNIVNGADPLDANALHGPKERAFFRAINGQRDAVVVDRWAQRAAEPWNPLPDEKGITPAHYRRLEEAYRLAADYLGVDARDVQATVWVHVRGSAE